MTQSTLPPVQGVRLPKPAKSGARAGAVPTEIPMPPPPSDNADATVTADASDDDGTAADNVATVSPETLGLVRTFKLRVPVRDDKGRIYEALTIVEPEQHHYAAMQRAGGGTAGSHVLIAGLAGVPVEAIRMLKQRDHNPIKAWIEALLDGASDGDPKADPEAAGEQTWTLDLCAPIPTEGRPITMLTVREPDIGTGVATEKMRHEAEQTAALIAQLSGQTIPVIMRMKRRDVVRIERWIAPFSIAGEDLSKKARMLEQILAELGLSADGDLSRLSSLES